MSQDIAPIDPANPPTGVIHELLLAACTPQDLRRLCRDHPAFRPLLDQFSPNDGLDVMADRVIDYCRQFNLWDELLATVKERYRRQYDRFAPRLAEPPPVPDRHRAIYRTLQQPAYARLPADHIRSFEALIAEKTEGFVGRQFVFDKLDRFLARHKSGYFIILGEPGIGKTALMAQLVRTRGYAHHFNVATMNIRTPRQFLANACAQLIARYQLPYPALPPAATEDSGFLVRCLGDAAGEEDNRPVVLAADALDESDRAFIQRHDAGRRPNLLHLPGVLPEGAYLVVTTRPLHSLPLVVSTSEELILDPASEGNLSDVRTYIRDRLRANEALRARLDAWRCTESEFVKALETKSEGNFVYLYHVLPAIGEGRFQRGTVDDLPQGLRQYYGDHWRQMQIAEPLEFKELYAPIISRLAVAREPLPLHELQSWTGLDPNRIAYALERWREFLQVDESGGIARYRIYHTSFMDFLAKEVNLQQVEDTVIDRFFGPAEGS